MVLRDKNTLLIIGCLLSLVASYEAGNMVIDSEVIIEKQTVTNIRTYFWYDIPRILLAYLNNEGDYKTEMYKM